MGQPLYGPKIENFAIGAWCPTQDGSGPPSAVSITISVKNMGDLVLRLKSPERVDEIIGLLNQYKNEVWPKTAPDGPNRHSSKN